MAEPAVAEAIAFEDGRVVAVGTRDEVMALADEARVIELGDNVPIRASSTPTRTGSGTASLDWASTPQDAIEAAVSARLDVDRGAVGQPGPADELRGPGPRPG